MDQPKKPSLIRNEASQIRRQIFQWLSTLPPARIKDIFTIREEKNVKILQKMLDKRTANNKPLTTSEVKDGGFHYIKERQQVYYRAKYSIKFYSGSNKHKNSHVTQLGISLCQNLNMTRVAPNYFTIRISFLKQLEDCMDELSNYQLLFLTQLETDSLWFNKGDCHSFAEWIVYMFEWEIKKAYSQERGLSKAQLAKIAAERKITFYEYVKQHFSLQMIEERLEKVIKQYFIKDEGKNENEQNKKNYLLTKSKQRLRGQSDIHEFVVEFQWYSDNSSNDTFQVFTKLAEVLYQEYKQWTANKPFEDWLQKQKDQKQRKIEKLKKKKNKKNKEDKKQQSDQPNENGKHQQIHNQEKVQVENAIKIEDGQIEKEKKQKEDLKEQQTRTEKIQQDLGYENIDDATQNLEGGVQVVQKKKKNALVQQKGKPGTNKKVIRDRISEYYEIFSNQLIQNSSVYDKYRKVVYLIIQDFIRSQIIEVYSGNHQEKVQWKLQLYGSASAGFSLRHSDIDLVVLIEKNIVSLDQISQILKLQEWAVDCKLIQAQIPIITLQVNIQFSEIAMKSLTGKQLKKIEGQLFSVDLTLSSLGQPHSGVENTKQLRQIVEAHPHVRSICILLKQFLRVRNLNKPYKGGIGSYVLIILINAILTRKGIIELKKDATHPDNYRMIKEISQFMDKFIPFETVISSTKNTSVKPDKTIDLNIINPKTGHLLKTSAFNIKKIIVELRQLREFQEQAEEIMNTMNVNEKKNMKNYFLKAFNQFLYESIQ